MELEKFVVLLFKRTKEISFETSSYTWRGDYKKIPQYFVRLVMDSTKFINFNCDFQNGLCFSYRRRVASDQYYISRPEQAARCCCGGCANAIGYLNHFCFIDVPQYAEMYDESTGFWRPTTGCVLPRELRSVTCVRYHCLHYDKDDKIISLPRRDQLILYMVDHLADAFVDYVNWQEVCGDKLRLRNYSEESFLKFIDEWVKRSLNVGFESGIITEIKVSWREYYAKNPYVSEPETLQLSVANG